jgi:antitoxin FitA
LKPKSKAVNSRLTGDFESSSASPKKSSMAQIFVRGLNNKAVQRLKKRAKEDGRSLQAEVKIILEEASPNENREAFFKMADQIRHSLKGRKFSDSAILIREDRDR